MRAEISLVFIERAWEKHAMSISEVGLFYGVHFKQMREMGDKLVV